jgi:hypothetical protein
VKWATYYNENKFQVFIKQCKFACRLHGYRMPGVAAGRQAVGFSVFFSLMAAAFWDGKSCVYQQVPDTNYFTGPFGNCCKKYVLAAPFQNKSGLS